MAGWAMIDVLSQISVTCFFTSYLVVLVLELLRLAGRIPGRAIAVIGMMSVGIFTHAVYLSLRAGSVAGGDVGRLATWFDWSLLVALGLAIAFLVLYLRRPDTIISFFFLPALIAMVVVALAVRGLPPFGRTEAVELWRSAHALGMGVGTLAVLVGFLAGVMYLVQSWRLKNHRAGSTFRLPTLETLQRLNARCLVFSTTAVGIGVLAGVVMNLNRWGNVGWTDRGVLLSGLLFTWLAISTAVEFIDVPVGRGRKAAYLTFASLGFLVLAMIGVFTTPHGQVDHRSAPLAPSTAPLAPDPVKVRR